LDKDAITKAVKMKRLLSMNFPNTVIVPLTGVDPKDMSVEELSGLWKGKVCKGIRCHGMVFCYLVGLAYLKLFLTHYPLP